MGTESFGSAEMIAWVSPPLVRNSAWAFSARAPVDALICMTPPLLCSSASAIWVKTPVDSHTLFITPVTWLASTVQMGT